MLKETDLKQHDYIKIMWSAKAGGHIEIYHLKSNDNWYLCDDYPPEKMDHEDWEDILYDAEYDGNTYAFLTHDDFLLEMI